MNSLEWRVKKLENLLIGNNNAASVAHVYRILAKSGTQNQASILDQLNLVARQYLTHLDGSGRNYSKYLELYNQYKTKMNELDACDDSEVSSRAELVIAYEDELRKYMKDTTTMAETSDRLLNVERWPDLSAYQERLDKLQTITKEQYIQSTDIDKKTERLIELYNEIIVSFKKNSALWNQTLEAHEIEDKEPDEDI